MSRPGATAEDDGVLVSALIRGEPKSARSTALLVLDARDLRELARAEFVCEGPVPKPLHGYFTGNNRFGKWFYSYSSKFINICNVWTT